MCCVPCELNHWPRAPLRTLQSGAGALCVHSVPPSVPHSLTTQDCPIWYCVVRTPRYIPFLVPFLPLFITWFDRLLFGLFVHVSLTFNFPSCLHRSTLSLATVPLSVRLSVRSRGRPLRLYLYKRQWTGTRPIIHPSSIVMRYDYEDDADRWRIRRWALARFTLQRFQFLKHFCNNFGLAYWTRFSGEGSRNLAVRILEFGR